MVAKKKDTKEVIRGGKSKWTQCNGQQKIDKEQTISYETIHRI